MSIRVVTIKRNWAGSLSNRILEEDPNPKPAVGMGATRLMYSDRSPYTIIAISPSGREITVQADRAIRLDSNGMSASQDYRYEPDPWGSTVVLSLRRNGRWVEKGQSMTGTAYALGVRELYYDYSF